MAHALRIGELAHETGLSIDAIRFYEREGLVRHPPRSEGGFRLFGQDDSERLRFIRKAQDLGFSLGEIRELLALRHQNLHACADVRERLARKLAATREKLAELRSLERSLGRALRKCDQELETGGPLHRGNCPMLDEIANATGSRRTKR
ncbi:MAG: heavy metal-responsive transcriptional regulator [Bryobacteraceae bacterium]